MDLVYEVITIVCGDIIHLSELRQLQVVTAMSRGVYEVDVCLLCILFYTWRALQLLTLDDLKGRPRKSLERAWAERERDGGICLFLLSVRPWFVSCKQNKTFFESDVLLVAKYQSRITKWFQFKDNKLEDILWLMLHFQRNGDGRKCWKWHALPHDDQNGN